MGRLAYEERAKLAQNPMGKRLFETMARKKTNLSVAADFASAAQVRLGLACWAAAQRGPGERGIAEDCLPRLCSCKVLELADQIGPHICCLKTHVDQYDTWSTELADKLVELSKKHGARCPLRPVPSPLPLPGDRGTPPFVSRHVVPTRRHHWLDEHCSLCHPQSRSLARKMPTCYFFRV